MATLTLDRMAAAACTTSSAAVSTATRPTRSGWCRTSRRCSTTTRCSPRPTSRPTRSRGNAELRRGRPRDPRLRRSRDDRPGRRRSTPPRTPTARGEEGRFFVWTPERRSSGAAPEEARLASAYYGVSESGNFEGKNIPTAARSAAEVALELGLEAADAEQRLRTIRKKLYQVRSKRVPPLMDRKILPAWNGLMISAFARAAFVFGEPDYAERASRAATFILSQMGDRLGLMRSFLGDAAAGRGFLDDYAFMIAALLDLYEVSFEPQRLRQAVALQTTLDRYFRDERGGYYLTRDDGERLLAREKPSYDGAEPSGNSVELMNLLRLHELTSDDRYRVAAEKLLKSFEMVWRRSPTSVPYLLSGVDFWLEGGLEIVIVAPESIEQAEPFLNRMRAVFAPNRVVAVVTEGKLLRRAAEVIPLVSGKKARGGKPTAYVCERRVCDLPTTDPEVFAAQLQRRGKDAKAPPLPSGQ